MNLSFEAREKTAVAMYLEELDYSPIRELQAMAHKTAVLKGFWDMPNRIRAIQPDAAHFITATQLMNAVSELAECNEWARKGNPESDHVPSISGMEEEVADCVIRLLDLAERNGWNLARAIKEKMLYNLGREHLNGGKKY